jgi:hypothetical protein
LFTPSSAAPRSANLISKLRKENGAPLGVPKNNTRKAHTALPDDRVPDERLLLAGL